MSSEDRKVIIKPTMDATGVREGAEEVKKTTADMAQAVAAQGRKAGEGLEDIGEGAKRGATEVERSKRSLIASLQRVTAAAEAGGKDTAKYFELIGRQRGVSAEELEPYISKLNAAQAAQAAASASLGTMGVSAKQTTAALRQVPAQFTDIFTSLSAGQPPLQVFLQQGGQLKDLFGGAGAAAQALGGYVLKLITPFTLLAAGIGAVTVGYFAGRKEAQEYTRALVLSGGAAGVTAGQLADMARQIAAIGPITQGKAAEVLAQLSAAGNIGADGLQRFARAAIELERAGGPAAEETAKAFSQLAKEPFAAAVKLSEATRFLSAATAEQILQLEQQGRTTEAARLAQEEYARAIEERAPQLQERLGLVEAAWVGIKDATKGAIDILKDIGRADTLQQQIQDIDVAISQAQRLQGGGGGLIELFARRREVELKATRELLLEQVRLTRASATAQGERVRQDEAGIRWLREGQAFLSSQAKLEAEIASIRAVGEAAGRSEADIQERIAKARERALGKDQTKQDQAATRELEQRARLVAELSGLTATYSQDLARLNVELAAGNINYEEFEALTAELTARQPVVRKGVEAQARATAEEARQLAAADKAREQYIKGLEQQTQAGDRTLLTLQDEYIALVAGRDTLREVQLLRLENEAIAADAYATAAAQGSLDATLWRQRAQQLRDEIALRRAVAGAAASKDVDEANARAADNAAREWQRVSDQIGQSLTDALVNGGKSASEVLRGVFRALVLRPVVDAIVRPLSIAINGALGLGGPAGFGGAGVAGVPGGGAGGGLFQLASLANLSSSFAAGSQLTAVGATGTALSASGSLFAGGQYASGFGVGAGALAPYVAAYLLARQASIGIADGYSFGGSGNTLNNLGIAGGITNRLFGRRNPEVQASGVTGAVSSQGFFGQTYADWLAEGGTFRSDKRGRDMGAVGTELQALLTAEVQGLYAATAAYAEALGLPAETARNYSREFGIAWGDSEEANEKALKAAIAALGNDLAGLYSGPLTVFQRAGEAIADTLRRLAGLQTFSVALNGLGGVFSQLARLSVEAREQIIDFAGGTEALSQQSLNFVQRFYSREEIAGLKARDVQTALGQVGITQDVGTREQFRALVEGTDVSTEAGRERLALLLRVSTEFSELADYFAETGLSLAATAAGAPVVSQLESLLLNPSQAQIDATNNVAAEVRAVAEAVRDLINVSQNPPQQVYGPVYELARP